jgi:hypothetical protein
MKKLLLIIILLFSLKSSAQVRLNQHRAEIYKEFASQTPEFGAFENGVQHMSVTLDKSYVRFVFDDNGFCNLVMVVPLTQGDLNFFVELYNKMYVIISPTQWRMYSNNGAIASIELVTHEGVSFFIWN